MKFTVSEKKKHSDLEKEIVKYWKENGTFEKSVENRSKDNNFRFDDGPPFITGLPHHGHLLVSTVKDSVARYWTMQGKRVERSWGWDCHGLPAEVKTEEKLGIKDRSEIGTRISVEDYVKECREAMVQGSMAWNNTIDRMGRWVDMTKPYRTMDKEYMESVWWAFKELYEKGKLYEGEKVLVYCTRDATPISKSEVAMENSYKEVTDPSVFVYFKLADQDRFKNKYLLAWTTTPWTLPANVALAVNPDLKYVEVEYEGKNLILAKDLYGKVLTDEKHQPLNYKLIGDFDVENLVGERYEPLLENHGPNAQRVVATDFVTAEDGSGVVHIAPAYGEDDFELAKVENLPVVHMVDEVGNYASGRWQGKNIWEVNKEIAKTLVEEGVALKIDYIKHEYPHCHRCGTKLMYRAHSSWFMDIQAQKDDMLAANDTINWVPSHLKEKRFKNILLSAPDWNLSRDRFWATPIPVWKGQKSDGVEVVKVFGSYEEFTEFTGLSLDDYHLPMVMDVEFELEGVTMRHIGKVLDCWFESGSVPFAQYHYPFENKEMFEATFPADFINESIDQTRGWFYSLMAVNVGLFNKAPFENVICTGFLNAADGQKLSKKLKNYTEPTELMDKFSADAERLHFLSSPLVGGEDASLTDKEVEVVERKLAMFSNTYDFFVMYASVDGWGSEVAYKDGNILAPVSENILDKWIVSRLQSLIKEVSDGMEEYQLNEATRGIIPFLDDLSNWYVRRGRKRFWKSENDGDKESAYHTLYYVLVQFAKVLAPFSPFISEDIYRKLTGEESVHLVDFPVYDAQLVGDKLDKEMANVRELIRVGLSYRAKAGIKVRQPLAMAYVPRMSEELAEIVKEELNVKDLGRYHMHSPDYDLNKKKGLTFIEHYVEWVKVRDGESQWKPDCFCSDASINDYGGFHAVMLDTEITPELKQEGLMREVVRVVQAARKTAGLNVDDRIRLNLETSDEELKEAIAKFKTEIAGEVLAKEWSDDTLSYSEEAKIEGQDLALSLEKD
jgi:isoleucyl-tRNA synthetase